MLRRILPATLMVVLAACGNSEPPPPAATTAAPAPAAAPAKAPPPAPAKEETPSGMCAHLTADEIVNAFGGQLTFGPARESNRGAACQVPIKAGVDGNSFTFGTTIEGNYLEYKKYERMSSIDFEYIEGLGAEAFLINGAQLGINVGDGRYLNLSVQLITMDGLPLPKEDIGAGLQDLGRKLLDRF